MKAIGLCLAVFCLAKIVSPADVGEQCSSDNVCKSSVMCCVRSSGKGRGKCTMYGARGEPCEPGGGKTIHGKCPCKPGGFCLNGTCRNVTLDGDVGRQCMANDGCTEGKTCCATPSGRRKGTCKMYGDPGDPCEESGSAIFYVNCPCKQGSVCKNGKCMDKVSPTDVGKECTSDNACTNLVTCCVRSSGKGKGMCTMYGDRGEPCEPGGAQTIHGKCPCKPGDFCLNRTCRNATLDGDVGRQCMADDGCTEGKTCCATPSGRGKGTCKMYGDPGDPCEESGSAIFYVNCPCKQGSVCKNGECVDKLDSGKKCMADSGCTRRKTCCTTPTGKGQGMCKLYARPGDPCQPGAMKTIHVECPCIQGFICVQGSCVRNTTNPAAPATK